MNDINIDEAFHDLMRSEFLELGKKEPYFRWDIVARCCKTMEDGKYVVISDGHEKKVECSCSSRDLFDYGCRCGFLENKHGK